MTNQCQGQPQLGIPVHSQTASVPDLQDQHARGNRLVNAFQFFVNIPKTTSFFFSLFKRRGICFLSFFTKTLLVLLRRVFKYIFFMWVNFYPLKKFHFLTSIISTMIDILRLFQFRQEFLKWLLKRKM